MSLATSNRDGGRTNEAGHLRGVTKGVHGEVQTGLNVTQRAAGANMSVDVAIGDAIIPRSDATYGHPAWNDAVYNQVIATADGSNPRRDIVVMYIDYGQAPSTGVANNTNGVVKIKSVSGTAAGSPTDPSDATIQSSVGSGNPYVKLARVRVAAGATSISNSVIDDLRSLAAYRAGSGWIALGSAWDTWQYNGWNSTYRIATITVPDSSIFTLGQKIHYYQTTGGWKYGMIVDKPSGTTIDVYQGNSTSGYTLNNERIYLPAYSRDRSPDGFPMNPAIWTQQLTDTGVDRQFSATPNGTNWYNQASLVLSMPKGVWDVYYSAFMRFTRTAGGSGSSLITTLSNTTSTETIVESTVGVIISVTFSSGGTGTYTATGMCQSQFTLNNTTNQAYNLLAKALQGGTGLTTQGASSFTPTVIRATCAYL